MSEVATGEVIDPKDILWNQPNLTTKGVLAYFEEQGYVVIKKSLEIEDDNIPARP